MKRNSCDPLVDVVVVDQATESAPAADAATNVSSEAQAEGMI